MKEEIWRYDQHLNLDDLDVGEEGVISTLKRVVGRRGLVIWKLRKICGAEEIHRASSESSSLVHASMA